MVNFHVSTISSRRCRPSQIVCVPGRSGTNQAKIFRGRMGAIVQTGCVLSQQDYLFFADTTKRTFIGERSFWHIEEDRTETDQCGAIFT